MDRAAPSHCGRRAGDHDRLTQLVRAYSASMDVSPGLAADADIVRLAAVRDGRVVGTTVAVMAHEVAGGFLAADAFFSGPA
ncbi:hypothetical protein [Streptomyces canarius]|uniref:N-acetyltransferase domain-containing protein n=2 Tax=Streptomyces TaxID=1883 RepID=A0ABQ3DCA5_9ACTN|nr:hypothetical protein GCM10010345_90460 [Streptomyces canarius]